MYQVVYSIWDNRLLYWASISGRSDIVDLNLAPPNICTNVADSTTSKYNVIAAVDMQALDHPAINSIYTNRTERDKVVQLFVLILYAHRYVCGWLAGTEKRF